MQNAEDIQKLICTALEIEEADINRNVKELGVHSLQLIKLSGKLKKCGIKLPFSEMMENPCVSAWVMKAALETEKIEEESCVCLAMEQELPKGHIPMNDIQYAYWVGRDDCRPLGGVDCHVYMEFDGQELEANRLEEAYIAVCLRHPMLRAKYHNDGTYEIMESPYADSLTVYDLEGMDPCRQQEYLNRVRNDRSFRKMNSEQGEMFAAALSMLGKGKGRVHVDINLLSCDARSIHILLEDFASAYMGKELEQLDFKPIQMKETTQARHYWEERLPSLPLYPELPLAEQPNKLHGCEYIRHVVHIAQRDYIQLQNHCNLHGLTVAMVLLAAYAEVLDRWSTNSNFLINMPLFNRADGSEDIVTDTTEVLLLEVDMGECVSLAERAKRIEERFYREMKYVSYSGVQVQRELVKRYPGEQAYAPVVYSCMLGHELISKKVECIGKLEYMVSQTPGVWIDCQIAEVSGEMAVSWDVPKGLLPEGIAEEMFAAYTGMIKELCVDASFLNKNAEVLGMSQIRKLAKREICGIGTGNHTYTDNLMMQQGLFAPLKARALAEPDRTALIEYGTDRHISYGELYRIALKVGSLLQANGVAVGDKVAVTMDRGIEQLEAVLGILAAGAAYVPVSVGQPYARRCMVHSRMGIAYVLSGGSALKSVEFPEETAILDIAQADEFESCEAAVIDVSALAYVILTSGSTGEPKGVEISHSGAANTIVDVLERYGIDETAVILGISAMDFDLSVFDVFGTLATGAALVVLSEDSQRNPAVWLDAIERYGVSVWNSVPILIRMLLTYAQSRNSILPGLKKVILSGDWIGLELPDMLQITAPNATLISMGGATEASIWSNYYVVKDGIPKGWTSIPYGTPLTGQSFLVMDEKGRPCPDWVAGELWIGGAGVALGYCADEQLTKSRFVNYHGQRYYRTGDLGRYRENLIEFMGRMDFQVKIRGHRIETGEIEHALLKMEGVTNAVVVKAGSREENFLAAYLVTDESFSADAESVQENAGKHLPDYMVPSVVMFLENLPLSANGKIDRKCLPKPLKSKKVKVEAKTETERKLLNIWRQLFQCDDISCDDNYFRLGGDSLSAVKMSAEIHKVFDIEVPIHVFFEQCILSELAAYIDEQGKIVDDLPVIVANKQVWNEPFALSGIQQAYFAGSGEDIVLGGTSTHAYFEMDCQELSIHKLDECLNQMIVFHAMMRAVICEDGSQYIQEHVPQYHVEIHDVQVLDVERNRLREEMTAFSFAIGTWPYFRICVTRCGDTNILHMLFDNIIFDGYSIYLIIREMTERYLGHYIEGSEWEISYRDYICCLDAIKESRRYRADREYWIKEIREISASPELPYKQSAELIKEHTFWHLKGNLSTEQWQTIRERAHAYGITPSMVIITAYAQAIARYSKKQRFALNLTQFNRSFHHPQLENMVGEFTNPIVLAVDMSQSSSFLECAKGLQRKLLEDMEHPYFDGVKVQREMARSSGGSQKTVPVVFTSTLGFGAFDTKKLLGKLVYTATQTPQVWMDLQVIEADGGLLINFDVVKELFEQQVPEGVMASMMCVLEKLAKNTSCWQRTCKTLAKITAVPDHRVTKTLDTALTLDELFIRRVKQNPEATALVTLDMEYTYSMLMEMAESVARQIPPCKIAAVVMEKSVWQIAAVLGVLLSGAAYLPIDAENPMVRKRTILEQAGVNTVVTQQSFVPEVSKLGCKYLVVADAVRINLPKTDMDIDEQNAVEEAQDNMLYHETPRNPDSPAYVIYTSGSTGVPKGVVISHRSALNTILDVNERFGVSAADRAIALSNLGFDLSVYDIFGMIAAGGAIVMPKHKGRKDPAHWQKLLSECRVTLWNTSPALMQMMVEHASVNHVENTLRLVMMSGDWIPLFLPDQIHEKLSLTCKVVSLGGATEASIWSNYYIVERIASGWKSIPYGYPLTNQYFRILNEQMLDCPAYTIGRLFIGGDGLAIGYLNDTDKTSKRFITHPDTGERLYDTGDLGRFWSDGTMEFLGREDFQVKIRGHRIELGEIESVLCKLPDVERAVVTTYRHDSGKTELGAFMMLKPESSMTNEAERLVCDTIGNRHWRLKPGKIRDLLSKHLPSYMIPSVYMILEKLPLTDNGKADVKALRGLMEQMDSECSDDGELGNLSELERKVANVWADVLGCQAERDDDFFDCGGDSVMMVKLINGLKQKYGYEISMDCVFENPTIGELAARIGDI